MKSGWLNQLLRHQVECPAEVSLSLGKARETHQRSGGGCDGFPMSRDRVRPWRGRPPCKPIPTPL
jgi:hypothetical protein